MRSTGSKNPLIVEPDSDLDLAFQPPSSQDVIFFHQGQVGAPDDPHALDLQLECELAKHR